MSDSEDSIPPGCQSGSNQQPTTDGVSRSEQKSHWGSLTGSDIYLQPANYYEKYADENDKDSGYEKGFIPLGDPTGLGGAMAGFLAGAATQAIVHQVVKRRWVTVKITNNTCCKDLVEPHWAFENGKTEVSPDFLIPSGSTGEAMFKGQTLKGVLSYEIAEKGELQGTHRVLIVFKVLYFRGFEVGKWLDIGSDRANQLGVKIIPKKRNPQTGKEEWPSTNDLKNGKLYNEHSAKCLKDSAGEWHIFRSNGLTFRFTMSDTGAAVAKIYMYDTPNKSATAS